MKEVLVLLAVLAMGNAATFEPGLRVKFNVGLKVTEDFFYELPRNVTRAIAMGWKKMARPTSPLPTLEMYCPLEYVICCLYDPDTEYVAGVQAGVNKKYFKGAVFDWDKQGFIAWTPPPVTTGDESLTYMVKMMYFVTAETLAKSKAERMKAAVADQVLQEDAFWLMGFNQELIKVPTDTKGMVDVGFTKQNCIPWMGTHYFYKMTKETTCAADTILNWFLLTDSDKGIGAGLITIGEAESISGEKFFYERPATLAVKGIVKTCPDCLAKLADNPTITTMHIYFIDKPWHVGCSLF